MTSLKQETGKHSMVGLYAQCQSIDGIRTWEGFVKEVNEHGIVLTYEARGYQYVTLACWPAIAAVDTRDEIEGKPSKADKPEVKPTNGKPTAAAAK